MRSIGATAAVITLLSAMLGSCGDSNAAPSETDMLFSSQIAAKAKMSEVLKDPDSARYTDVKSYKASIDGGPTFYVFCGSVNAKNGFGGYSGNERFFASASIAVLENQVTDFDVLQSKLCIPSNKLQDAWL